MEESSTVYCFANWKEREDGRGKEPDLPDFVEDYVCIWSNWDCPWAIFEVEVDEPEPELTLVSEDLETLLDSAQSYPPALALAVYELEQETPANRSGFDVHFCAVLRKYLENQSRAPYMLIESKEDEQGYLRRGEFVWAIRYFPETNEISWVSEDFQIYTNSAKDFNVNDEQIKRLTYDKSEN
ncbi:MAG: hypothetical protein KC897_07695 [Candidatus Omnitrophica bacterium]|nr:hypothetical protein [Candidatus Omnitrophota bacterium]MCB9720963.1 hypothetical protein [Candidatus Omnitrophota bacterium]